MNGESPQDSPRLKEIQSLSTNSFASEIEAYRFNQCLESNLTSRTTLLNGSSHDPHPEPIVLSSDLLEQFGPTINTHKLNIPVYTPDQSAEALKVSTHGAGDP